MFILFGGGNMWNKAFKYKIRVDGWLGNAVNEYDVAGKGKFWWELIMLTSLYVVPKYTNKSLSARARQWSWQSAWHLPWHGLVIEENVIMVQANNLDDDVCPWDARCMQIISFAFLVSTAL